MKKHWASSTTDPLKPISDRLDVAAQANRLKHEKIKQTIKAIEDRLPEYSDTVTRLAPEVTHLTQEWSEALQRWHTHQIDDRTLGHIREQHLRKAIELGAARFMLMKSTKEIQRLQARAKDLEKRLVTEVTTDDEKTLATTNSQNAPALGLWWICNERVLSFKWPAHLVEAISGVKDIEANHFDEWTKISLVHDEFWGMSHDAFPYGRVIENLQNECFDILGDSAFATNSEEQSLICHEFHLPVEQTRSRVESSSRTKTEL